MVWWILISLTAVGLLLLCAMVIPIARRKEQGARALLIVVLASCIAGMLMHVLSVSLGLIALLLFGLVVTYSLRLSIVITLAKMSWSRISPLAARFLVTQAWLGRFSSSGRFHEQIALLDRSELTSCITASPLLQPREKRMIQSVLEYDDKQVHAYMKPIKDIVVVKHDETIGPLLLDELHHSDQQIFPVVNEGHAIIGTVLYESLMKASHHDVTIKSLMQPQVLRVSQHTSLDEVLESMIHNTSWLAVVHSGEDVGIVFLDDLIGVLLGKQGR